MKRKLALITGLILLLSLAAGTAYADIKKIRFEQLRNGEIEMTWKDTGDDGPYEISWTNDSWKKHEATDGESYDSTSATLKQLVPGVTYDITVRGQTTEATKTYKVPKTTFTDYSKGKKVTIDKDTFDLETDDIYRTVTLRLYYPRLSKERRFFWTLALKTPKGYASYVVYDERLVLNPRGSFAQGQFDFSVFMNNVEDTFGKIPSGDYAFEMYMDGQYYGAAGFYVYGR